VGVNLAGYLDSALGVGEVARGIASALAAVGVPVAAHTLTAHRVASVPGPAAPREAARHPVSLICANAEGMEGAHAELGDDWFDNRYAIGFWWWESVAFPARWERAFDLLDELWVGSRYVADALGPVARVPVLRMPVPVSVPRAAPASRNELGLPDGALFLTAFDYGGVFARKNPLGAVEAFRRAFAPGERAALVIKCLGADRHAVEHARLLDAVADDERITLIDAVLSDEAMGALVASCDCYVSLHRAEGFGLPIAEAMLLGKPVVATGYGGPADYLTEQTGFPIRHRSTEIGPGNEPYPASGTWAEPDMEHAAAMMRHVVEHPEDAARRAGRAREHMEHEHSTHAAGKAMAARVSRVVGLPTDHDGNPVAVPTDELLRRIRAEPGVPRGLNLPRGLVRRAALRISRPQAVHQRQIDEELARTLRTLDERIQGLAASQASLLAEIRGLTEQHGEDDGPAR
jgi:glycosyltransferase involved in cell wall biosynthesis